MTGRVRGQCRTCGEVTVDTSRVSLLVWRDSADGSAAFRCARCGMLVVTPVTRQAAEVLRSGGVDVRVVDRPHDLGGQRHGAPLDLDDLFAFQELIWGSDEADDISRD